VRRSHTVHAICEEYRASSTLDRRYDEADRGRRRIACPTLVPWSDTGPLGRWYEPLDVWKTWADDVDGGPVSAGHFIPEATPDETARRLFEFLT
jgi:haloacetate dehalogenase